MPNNLKLFQFGIADPTLATWVFMCKPFGVSTTARSIKYLNKLLSHLLVKLFWFVEHRVIKFEEAQILVA